MGASITSVIVGTAKEERVPIPVIPPDEPGELSRLSDAAVFAAGFAFSVATTLVMSMFGIRERVARWGERWGLRRPGPIELYIAHDAGRVLSEDQFNSLRLAAGLADKSDGADDATPDADELRAILRRIRELLRHALPDGK